MSRRLTDHSSDNRAEEVRKRRASRSQQRISSASSRVVNPVHVRPVTVRGNIFGTPLLKQAGTKRARRQFYLTMDQAAGAEVRLPALPAFNPGWRILSGLIFIAAVVGIFSMLNSDFFRITSVPVSGLQRVSSEEVTSMLHLENLSIVLVDKKQIETSIAQNFPELRDIKVTVDMPNLITIEAAERQPMLAWQKGDQLTWIDAEGYLFPARGDAGPLITINTGDDIPLAPLPIDIEEIEAMESGENETEAATISEAQANEQQNPTIVRTADPVLLETAQALSQQLPLDTALAYDSSHGLGWTDASGWQVYIGRNFGAFEEKYALYQQIANHLAGQGIQPVLVSVEHLNAPFYRLEQD